jgi:tetratricopeptide (TPR) repeat protein
MKTAFLVGVALIIGLLVGLLVSKGKKESVSPSTTASQAPAVNFQQNLGLLEDLVAKDPANRNAWVQLGHGYFDSDQYIKAVEAYNKALELDPNDPDILTDQGVMFRALGWYDKAVDNFVKANRLKPSHAQSLYNLGVVYRYDLQDLDKAREAWKKYLALNPVGPGVEQIRAEMEVLESHPPLPQGK